MHAPQPPSRPRPQASALSLDIAAWAHPPPAVSRSPSLILLLMISLDLPRGRSCGARRARSSLGPRSRSPSSRSPRATRRPPRPRRSAAPTSASLGCSLQRRRSSWREKDGSPGAPPSAPPLHQPGRWLQGRQICSCTPHESAAAPQHSATDDVPPARATDPQGLALRVITTQALDALLTSGQTFLGDGGENCHLCSGAGNMVPMSIK